VLILNSGKEFLELVASYYTNGNRPDSLPNSIAASARFLNSKGVTQIGLLGICWGGCIVQHIISIGRKT